MATLPAPGECHAKYPPAGTAHAAMPAGFSVSRPTARCSPPATRRIGLTILPRNLQKVPRNPKNLPRNLQEVPRNLQKVPQGAQTAPQNPSNLPHFLLKVPQASPTLPHPATAAPHPRAALPHRRAAAPRPPYATGASPPTLRRRRPCTSGTIYSARLIPYQGVWAFPWACCASSASCRHCSSSSSSCWSVQTA